MTERWRLGTWLGKRFHTEEHIVVRKGDGLVIRSRAAKAMPEETTLDDLDSIKCSLWAPSGVLRDVLPDVPRPILSRDEPPFLPDEEGPVSRNMKITQDILRKIGYTPGCTKCRKLSRNEYSWHTRRIVVPGLRAASRTYPVYRDRAEGAEQPKIAQGEPHWYRVSCLDHQLEIQKFHAVTQKVNMLGMPNGLVGSQNRTCQVEYLFRVQTRR